MQQYLDLLYYTKIVEYELIPAKLQFINVSASLCVHIPTMMTLYIHHIRVVNDDFVCTDLLLTTTPICQLVTFVLSYFLFAAYDASFSVLVVHKRPDQAVQGRPFRILTEDEHRRSWQGGP